MRALERCVVASALLASACVNAPEPATSARVDESRTTPAVGQGGTLRLADPAVSGLGTESREALDRAPFAMLVLPAEYASGSQVMSDAHWAALSYHGQGISISLHATNVWHDGASQDDLAALPTPTTSVRGHLAWETENEGVQSVSWNEHDVALALEVECEDPEGDPRCQDAAFVRELAGHLVAAQEPVR